MQWTYRRGAMGRAGLFTMWLMMVAFTLSGCEAMGLLAAMGGERVKAVYPLEDRPTLVMVEDPDNALGDPTLARLIASHVGYHLTENRAIQNAEVIDQRELVALAERLEDEYRRMPIDRIGKELGAEQVIHVLIDETRLETAPGMYRPTAKVEIKVIDAVESKRLFPAAGRSSDRTAPPPGHRVQTQLQYRTEQIPSVGAQSTMLRGLAEQLGLDVAQIFYDHKRPEPGSRLP